MGNEKYHADLARKNRERSIDEFTNGRYTTVSVLALKAVVEAVDACASKEKLHFHLQPRAARAERDKWLRRNFPNLRKSYEILVDAYEYFRSRRHILGYQRAPIFLAWWWRFPTPEHGARAAKAIEAMEKILDVLQEKTGICFK